MADEEGVFRELGYLYQQMCDTCINSCDVLDKLKEKLEKQKKKLEEKIEIEKLEEKKRTLFKLKLAECKLFINLIVKKEKKVKKEKEMKKKKKEEKYVSSFMQKLLSQVEDCGPDADRK